MVRSHRVQRFLHAWKKYDISPQQRVAIRQMEKASRQREILQLRKAGGSHKEGDSDVEYEDAWNKMSDEEKRVKLMSMNDNEKEVHRDREYRRQTRINNEAPFDFEAFFSDHFLDRDTCPVCTSQEDMPTPLLVSIFL